jgi:hypothetical protein
MAGRVPFIEVRSALAEAYFQAESNGALSERSESKGTLVEMGRFSGLFSRTTGFLSPVCPPCRY